MKENSTIIQSIMYAESINSEKYFSIPVLDIETIEMLKTHSGGNIEILKDLFGSFFPEAEEQIQEMEQAVEINNTEMFAKSVHGLSGISATIGANQLKVLTADMEKLAKAGNLEQAYKLMSLLDQLFQKFVEEANAFIQQ